MYDIPPKWGEVVAVTVFCRAHMLAFKVGDENRVTVAGPLTYVLSLRV